MDKGSAGARDRPHSGNPESMRGTRFQTCVRSNAIGRGIDKIGILSHEKDPVQRGSLTPPTVDIHGRRLGWPAPPVLAVTRRSPRAQGD